MKTQFKGLLAAAAGVAVAGYAAGASAAPIPFDLNVATADFKHNATDLGSTLSSITQLGFQQVTNSTINLNSVTGKFDDTGDLIITNFVKNNTSTTFFDNTGDLTVH